MTGLTVFIVGTLGTLYIINSEDVQTPSTDSSQAAIPRGLSWAGIGLGVIVLLVLAYVGVRAAIRFRRSRRAKREATSARRIVERVVLRRGVDDVAELDELARQDSASAVGDALLRREVEAIWISESTARSEAEAQLFDYLPVWPREAKRMYNHLRLALAVTASRRLSGSSSDVGGAVLGKWIVLRQRWPDLYDAAMADEEAMRALEVAAGDGALDALLESSSVTYEPDLERFLASHPSLSASISELRHVA